jgi:FKBP-type peptidyl-prolyl cis-trans isomerase
MTQRSSHVSGMRVLLVAALALATAGALAGCSGATPSAPQTTPADTAATQPATTTATAEATPSAEWTPVAPKNVKTPKTLIIKDIKVGTGPKAKRGDGLTVDYIGWLKDGKKFDSSLDSGQPFQFTLGGGQVIAGWDNGMVGMQVGGVRRLIIPAAMGYGAQGAGGVIPPNATLVFEVKLLKIN